MCDWQWDALAEIYLFNKDTSEEIYCLCSRVFVRNKEEKFKQVSCEKDDSCSESEATAFKERILTNSEIVKEKDAELVSCYYSASHTDNLSTDEHDSVRESQATNSSRSALLIKSLQSSDSGADLSEYLKNDFDTSWHKYWASNGERIIWNSWIAKYSDYINPQFLQQQEGATTSTVDKEVKEESLSNKRGNVQFSFEKKDYDKYNDSVVGDNKEEKKPIKHHFLLRELSGSDSYDKLNGEVSEGWNPLSPLSIDCEFEAERLITSRCGSHASSSLRTVDSLTNVTRMTVSSLDLSNSSKTTDSISSVSSVQSSLSSTSSEEIDDTQDYDNQWNILWKNHYEEEYLKNYQQFILSINSQDDGLVEVAVDYKQSIKLSKTKVARQSKSTSDDNDFNSDVEIKKLHQKFVNNKIKQKRAVSKVSSMLNSLNVDDKQSIISMDVENKDSSSSLDDNIDNEQMSSLGLPLAFGSSRGNFKQPRNQIKRPINETDIYDTSSNNRIKASFALLGIEMNEGKRPKLLGNVEYKMKHIRLQNRHLKFHKNKLDNPKHIRFDDDGNPVPYEAEEEIDQQVSSSDNFEMNHSSTDNEEYDPNRMSPLFKTPQLSTDEFLQNNRKKKRKRKINYPPEIKENPKLKKYWQRRFSLFNQFDMGIKLDEESWYSVTPEIVAKHTAERCKTDVIIDAFCGAGGNSIQFAFTCQKVIAIDVDPKKIEIARNNAKVYGVDDRIEFIVGDFFRLANDFKADVVFLSPPWGGPSYLKQSTYELEEYLQPAPLTTLLESARKISPNIAIYLPKNSNTFDLMKEAGPGKSVEIEQNFINKKLIAITAYYNELIKNI